MLTRSITQQLHTGYNNNLLLSVVLQQSGSFRQLTPIVGWSGVGRLYQSTSNTATKFAWKGKHTSGDTNDLVVGYSGYTKNTTNDHGIGSGRGSGRGRGGGSSNYRSSSSYDMDESSSGRGGSSRGGGSRGGSSIYRSSYDVDESSSGARGGFGGSGRGRGRGGSTSNYRDRDETRGDGDRGGRGGRGGGRGGSTTSRSSFNNDMEEGTREYNSSNSSRPRFQRQPAEEEERSSERQYRPVREERQSEQKYFRPQERENSRSEYRSDYQRRSPESHLEEQRQPRYPKKTDTYDRFRSGIATRGVPRSSPSSSSSSSYTSRGDGGNGRFNKRVDNNDHDDNDSMDTNEGYDKDAARASPSKTYIKMRGEGLFGLHPVSIALTSDNRTIHSLFIQESLYGRLMEKQDINVQLIEQDNDQVEDGAEAETLADIDMDNDMDDEDDGEDNDISTANRKTRRQEQDQDQDNNGRSANSRYRGRKNIDAYHDVLASCKRLNINVIPISKQMLDVFSKFRLHQGLVLDCSPLTVYPISRLETPTPEQYKNRYPLFVALDELWDPQNTGAIIRSCHYFGADGVVITDKGSSPITPFASKASSGAIEEFPVYKTLSLSGFLNASKDKGWEIIGTSLSATSCELSSTQLTKPTIVVIGNEGFGLKDNVQRQCDKMIKIPQRSVPSSKVDSLNASVSAGIVLYQLMESNKVK
ncbi:hypothetical protein SAMD00019534_032440 [Acytostelium subglobosum LB1]|uniref:hypothetical protein n=1 Tax=Acytostelium subglobosum LB1 TaxID=1410327 RepID=UPI000644DEB2|nr:hypothetical protein SAMD00019534_032440 [Acytostelium subglobosum LB1]GAM20069.1 hypothetical protein SAMD00019534_032440 [Acytostelium subglobosum LB1]|eukprot:XP_012756831.1 hypothetical protein SAMD00019534_032440 [Acytostelium subglobosum LB1]